MKTNKTRFHFHLIFAFIALLLLMLPTQGQTKPEEKSSNDVEQLKSKLEQLQSLIEQQQRAMAEMQKRIDAIDDKTRASVVVPASLKVDSQPEARQATLEVAQTQKSDPPSSPVAHDKDKDKDKPVILAGWDK